MKIKISHLCALSVTLFAVALVGCGGGSSSGPTAPLPTPTPVPTNVTVTVLLRDTANAPVDGIVTLGGQRRATTEGTANFVNVAAGAGVASAEVNGATYSQNYVATSGANTVQISINPVAGGTSAGGGTTGTTPPNPPTF